MVEAGNSGKEEQWSHFECILEADLTGLTFRLDMKHEKYKTSKSKMSFHFWSESLRLLTDEEGGKKLCVRVGGSMLSQTSNWTGQGGCDVDCESLTSAKSQNHVVHSAPESVTALHCSKHKSFYIPFNNLNNLAPAYLCNFISNRHLTF